MELMKNDLGLLEIMRYATLENFGHLLKRDRKLLLEFVVALFFPLPQLTAEHVTWRIVDSL